ncbi:unnamed protein product [Owenia fusiformis]|uniref:Tudor domain-containing protein n=1 Tax=Owenia fusiformis TaxID=6347 RepID=A0A8S4P4Y3_OWEFU|nr:unnamed protein product [Owenia fusiformis]
MLSQLSLTQKLALVLASSTVGVVCIYLLFKSNDEDEELDKREREATSRQTVIKVDIPRKLVGSVIGRQGSTIKEIQKVTGARVNFDDKNRSETPENEDLPRTVTIRGSAENAQQAELMITEIIANQPLKKTVECPVPVRCLGRIIGRNGDTIRQLQRISSARIVIPREGDERDRDALKQIEITGTESEIQAALGLIEEKVQEDKGYRANLAVSQTNRRQRIQQKPQSQTTSDTPLPPSLDTSLPSHDTDPDTQVEDHTEKEVRRIPPGTQPDLESSDEEDNDLDFSHGDKVTSSEQISPQKMEPLEASQADGAAALPSSLVERDLTPYWPPTQEYVDVMVSAVDTAGHFWVQVVSPLSPHLDKLVDEMTNFYSKPDFHYIRPVTEAKVGDMVAAMFEADQSDKSWYRARITDVDRGKVELYYVDYGDSGEMPLCVCYPLKSDFLKIPFQAVECFLANVKPAGAGQEEWSDDASDCFEALTFAAQWKVLVAKPVGYKHLGGTHYAPCLVLTNTNDQQDININAELINRGFAESYETDNMLSMDDIAAAGDMTVTGMTGPSVFHQIKENAVKSSGEPNDTDKVKDDARAILESLADMVGDDIVNTCESTAIITASIDNRELTGETDNVVTMETNDSYDIIGASNGPSILEFHEESQHDTNVSIDDTTDVTSHDYSVQYEPEVDPVKDLIASSQNDVIINYGAKENNVIADDVENSTFSSCITAENVNSVRVTENDKGVCKYEVMAYNAGEDSVNSVDREHMGVEGDLKAISEPIKTGQSEDIDMCVVKKNAVEPAFVGIASTSCESGVKLLKVDAEDTFQVFDNSGNMNLDNKDNSEDIDLPGFTQSASIETKKIVKDDSKVDINTVEGPAGLITNLEIQNMTDNFTFPVGEGPYEGRCDHFMVSSCDTSISDADFEQHNNLDRSVSISQENVKVDVNVSDRHDVTFDKSLLEADLDNANNLMTEVMMDLNQMNQEGEQSFRELEELEASVDKLETHVLETGVESIPSRKPMITDCYAEDIVHKQEALLREIEEGIQDVVGKEDIEESELQTADRHVGQDQFDGENRIESLATAVEEQPILESQEMSVEEEQQIVESQVTTVEEQPTVESQESTQEKQQLFVSQECTVEKLSINKTTEEEQSIVESQGSSEEQPIVESLETMTEEEQHIVKSQETKREEEQPIVESLETTVEKEQPIVKSHETLVKEQPIAESQESTGEKKQVMVISQETAVEEQSIVLLQDVTVEKEQSIIKSIETTIEEEQPIIESHETSKEKEQLIVESQEVTLEDEQPIVESQEVTLEDEQPIVESQEVTLEGEQPIVESQEVTLEDEQPIVESQEVTLEDEQPIVESQEVTLEDEQPIVESQEVTLEDEQPIFESQEVTLEDEQPIVESQEVTLEDEQPIVESQEVTLEDEQPIVESQEVTLEDEQPIVESQEVTLEDEQPIVESQEVTLEDEKPIVESQEVTLEDEQPIVESQEVTLEDEQPIVESQEVTLEDEQLIVESQEVTLEDEQPIVESQEVTLEDEQPIVESQEVTLEDEQPIVESQEVTLEDEQPIVESQEVTLEDEQPIVESQEETLEDEQPIVESQEVTLEDEQPIVESQEVTLEDEQPIVESQEVTLEDEQPIVESQNVTLEDEQPIVESQETTVEEKQPMVPSQEITTDDEQPMVSSQETTVEEKQQIIEQQETTLEEKQQIIEPHETTVEEENQIIEQQETTVELEEPIIESQEIKVDEEHLVVESLESTGEKTLPIVEPQEITVEGDLIVESQEESLGEQPIVESQETLVEEKLPVVEPQQTAIEEGEVIVESHDQKEEQTIVEPPEMTLQEKQPTIESLETAVEEQFIVKSQETTIGKRGLIVDSQEETLEEKQPIIESQQTLDEEKLRIFETQETTIEEGEAIVELKEKIEEKQPVVESQEEMEEKQPIVQSQETLIEQEVPIVQPQKTTVKESEAIGESIEERIEKEQPIVESEEVTGEKKLPIFEPQEITVEEGEPIVGSQETLVEEKLPIGEPQETVTKEGEAIVETEEEIQEKQPNVESQKEILKEQQIVGSQETLDDEELPVVEPQGTTVEGEEPIVEPQEERVEKEQPVVDSQEISGDKELPPIEPWETTVEGEEPIVEPQETTIKEGGVIVELQEELEEKQPIISSQEEMEEKQPIVEPQETTVEVGESIVEPQETLIKEELPIVEPQETSIEEREAIVEPQETTIKEGEAIELQVEIEEKQPIVKSKDEKQPIGESQQPLVEEELPILEQQETTIEEEEPIVESQEEIIEEDLPIVESQGITVEEEGLNVKIQTVEQPIVESLETTVEVEQPTIESHETVDKKEQPIVEPQETTTEDQPVVESQPTIEEGPPIVESQEIKVKEQPIVVPQEHQRQHDLVTEPDLNENDQRELAEIFGKLLQASEGFEESDTEDIGTEYKVQEAIGSTMTFDSDKSKEDIPVPETYVNGEEELPLRRSIESYNLLTLVESDVNEESSEILKDDNVDDVCDVFVEFGKEKFRCDEMVSDIAHIPDDVAYNKLETSKEQQSIVPVTEDRDAQLQSDPQDTTKEHIDAKPFDHKKVTIAENKEESEQVHVHTQSLSILDMLERGNIDQKIRHCFPSFIIEQNCPTDTHPIEIVEKDNLNKHTQEISHRDDSDITEYTNVHPLENDSSVTYSADAQKTMFNLDTGEIGLEVFAEETNALVVQPTNDKSAYQHVANETIFLETHSTGINTLQKIESGGLNTDSNIMPLIQIPSTQDQKLHFINYDVAREIDSQVSADEINAPLVQSANDKSTKETDQHVLDDSIYLQTHYAGINTLQKLETGGLSTDSNLMTLIQIDSDHAHKDSGEDDKSRIGEQKQFIAEEKQDFVDSEKSIDEEQSVAESEPIVVEKDQLIVESEERPNEEQAVEESKQRTVEKEQSSEQTFVEEQQLIVESEERSNEEESVKKSKQRTVREEQLSEQISVEEQQLTVESEEKFSEEESVEESKQRTVEEEQSSEPTSVEGQQLIVESEERSNEEQAVEESKQRIFEEEQSSEQTSVEKQQLIVKSEERSNEEQAVEESKQRTFEKEQSSEQTFVEEQQLIIESEERSNEEQSVEKSKQRTVEREQSSEKSSVEDQYLIVESEERSNEEESVEESKQTSVEKQQLIVESEERSNEEESVGESKQRTVEEEQSSEQTSVEEQQLIIEYDEGSYEEQSVEELKERTVEEAQSFEQTSVEEEQLIIKSEESEQIAVKEEHSVIESEQTPFEEKQFTMESDETSHKEEQPLVEYKQKIVEESTFFETHASSLHVLEQLDTGNTTLNIAPTQKQSHSYLPGDNLCPYMEHKGVIYHTEDSERVADDSTQNDDHRLLVNDKDTSFTETKNNAPLLDMTNNNSETQLDQSKAFDEISGTESDIDIFPEITDNDDCSIGMQIDEPLNKFSEDQDYNNITSSAIETEVDLEHTHSPYKLQDDIQVVQLQAHMATCTIQDKDNETNKNSTQVESKIEITEAETKQEEHQNELDVDNTNDRKRDVDEEYKETTKENVEEISATESETETYPEFKDNLELQQHKDICIDQDLTPPATHDVQESSSPESDHQLFPEITGNEQPTTCLQETVEIKDTDVLSGDDAHAKEGRNILNEAALISPSDVEKVSADYTTQESGYELFPEVTDTAKGLLSENDEALLQANVNMNDIAKSPVQESDFDLFPDITDTDDIEVNISPLEKVDDDKSDTAPQLLSDNDEAPLQANVKMNDIATSAALESDFDLFPDITDTDDVEANDSPLEKFDDDKSDTAPVLPSENEEAPLEANVNMNDKEETAVLDSDFDLFPDITDTDDVEANDSPLEKVDDDKSDTAPKLPSENEETPLQANVNINDIAKSAVLDSDFDLFPDITDTDDVEVNDHPFEKVDDVKSDTAPKLLSENGEEANVNMNDIAKSPALDSDLDLFPDITDKHDVKVNDQLLATVDDKSETATGSLLDNDEAPLEANVNMDDKAETAVSESDFDLFPNITDTDDVEVNDHPLEQVDDDKSDTAPGLPSENEEGPLEANVNMNDKAETAVLDSDFVLFPNITDTDDVIVNDHSLEKVDGDKSDTAPGLPSENDEAPLQANVNMNDIAKSAVLESDFDLFPDIIDTDDDVTVDLHIETDVEKNNDRIDVANFPNISGSGLEECPLDFADSKLDNLTVELIQNVTGHTELDEQKYPGVAEHSHTGQEDDDPILKKNIEECVIIDSDGEIVDNEDDIKGVFEKLLTAPKDKDDSRTHNHSSIKDDDVSKEISTENLTNQINVLKEHGEHEAHQAENELFCKPTSEVPPSPVNPELVVNTRTLTADEEEARAILAFLLEETADDVTESDENNPIHKCEHQTPPQDRKQATILQNDTQKIKSSARIDEFGISNESNQKQFEQNTNYNANESIQSDNEWFIIDSPDQSIGSPVSSDFCIVDSASSDSQQSPEYSKKHENDNLSGDEFTDKMVSGITMEDKQQSSFVLEQGPEEHRKNCDTPPDSQCNGKFDVGKIEKDEEIEKFIDNTGDLGSGLINNGAKQNKKMIGSDEDSDGMCTISDVITRVNSEKGDDTKTKLTCNDDRLESKVTVNDLNIEATLIDENVESTNDSKTPVTCNDEELEIEGNINDLNIEAKLNDENVEITGDSMTTVTCNDEELESEGDINDLNIEAKLIDENVESTGDSKTPVTCNDEELEIERNINDLNIEAKLIDENVESTGDSKPSVTCNDEELEIERNINDLNIEAKLNDENVESTCDSKTPVTCNDEELEIERNINDLNIEAKLIDENVESTGDSKPTVTCNDGELEIEGNINDLNIKATLIDENEESTGDSKPTVTCNDEELESKGASNDLNIEAKLIDENVESTDDSKPSVTCNDEELEIDRNINDLNIEAKLNDENVESTCDSKTPVTCNDEELEIERNINNLNIEATLIDENVESTGDSKPSVTCNDEELEIVRNINDLNIEAKLNDENVESTCDSKTPVTCNDEELEIKRNINDLNIEAKLIDENVESTGDSKPTVTCNDGELEIEGNINDLNIEAKLIDENVESTGDSKPTVTCNDEELEIDRNVNDLNIEAKLIDENVESTGDSKPTVTCNDEELEIERNINDLNIEAKLIDENVESTGDSKPTVTCNDEVLEIERYINDLKMEPKLIDENVKSTDDSKPTVTFNDEELESEGDINDLNIEPKLIDKSVESTDDSKTTVTCNDEELESKGASNYLNIEANVIDENVKSTDDSNTVANCKDEELDSKVTVSDVDVKDTKKTNEIHQFTCLSDEGVEEITAAPVTDLVDIATAVNISHTSNEEFKNDYNGNADKAMKHRNPYRYSSTDYPEFSGKSVQYEGSYDTYIPDVMNLESCEVDRKFENMYENVSPRRCDIDIDKDGVEANSPIAAKSKSPDIETPRMMEHSEDCVIQTIEVFPTDTLKFGNVPTEQIEIGEELEKIYNQIGNTSNDFEKMNESVVHTAEMQMPTNTADNLSHEIVSGGINEGFADVDMKEPLKQNNADDILKIGIGCTGFADAGSELEQCLENIQQEMMDTVVAQTTELSYVNPEPLISEIHTYYKGTEKLLCNATINENYNDFDFISKDSHLEEAKGAVKDSEHICDTKNALVTAASPVSKTKKQREGVNAGESNLITYDEMTNSEDEEKYYIDVDEASFWSIHKSGLHVLDQIETGILPISMISVLRINLQACESEQSVPIDPVTKCVVISGEGRDRDMASAVSDTQPCCQEYTHVSSNPNTCTIHPILSDISKVDSYGCPCSTESSCESILSTSRASINEDETTLDTITPLIYAGVFSDQSNSEIHFTRNTIHISERGSVDKNKTNCIKFAPSELTTIHVKPTTPDGNLTGPGQTSIAAEHITANTQSSISDMPAVASDISSTFLDVPSNASDIPSNASTYDSTELDSLRLKDFVDTNDNTDTITTPRLGNLENITCKGPKLESLDGYLSETSNTEETIKYTRPKLESLDGYMSETSYTDDTRTYARPKLESLDGHMSETSNTEESIKYTRPKLESLDSYMSETSNAEELIKYTKPKLESLDGYMSETSNIEETVAYTRPKLKILDGYMSETSQTEETVTYTRPKLESLDGYTSEASHTEETIKYTRPKLESLDGYMSETSNTEETFKYTRPKLENLNGSSMSGISNSLKRANIDSVRVISSDRSEEIISSRRSQVKYRREGIIHNKASVKKSKVVGENYAIEQIKDNSKCMPNLTQFPTDNSHLKTVSNLQMQQIMREPSERVKKIQCQSSNSQLPTVDKKKHRLTSSSHFDMPDYSKNLDCTSEEHYLPRTRMSPFNQSTPDSLASSDMPCSHTAGLPTLVSKKIFRIKQPRNIKDQPELNERSKCEDGMKSLDECVRSVYDVITDVNATKPSVVLTSQDGSEVINKPILDPEQQNKYSFKIRPKSESDFVKIVLPSPKSSRRVIETDRVLAHHDDTKNLIQYGAKTPSRSHGGDMRPLSFTAISPTESTNMLPHKMTFPIRSTPHSYSVGFPYTPVPIPQPDLNTNEHEPSNKQRTLFDATTTQYFEDTEVKRSEVVVDLAPPKIQKRKIRVSKAGTGTTEKASDSTFVKKAVYNRRGQTPYQLDTVSDLDISGGDSLLGQNSLGIIHTPGVTELGECKLDMSNIDKHDTTDLQQHSFTVDLSNLDKESPNYDVGDSPLSQYNISKYIDSSYDDPGVHICDTQSNVSTYSWSSGWTSDSDTSLAESAHALHQLKQRKQHALHPARKCKVIKQGTTEQSRMNPYLNQPKPFAGSYEAKYWGGHRRKPHSYSRDVFASPMHGTPRDISKHDTPERFSVHNQAFLRKNSSSSHISDSDVQLSDFSNISTDSSTQHGQLFQSGTHWTSGPPLTPYCKQSSWEKAGKLKWSQGKRLSNPSRTHQSNVKFEDCWSDF